MDEEVSCSGVSLQQQQQPQFRSNQDNLPYKERLHEFTRRAKMTSPMFQTINEGAAHSQKFRSIVVVDGTTYESSNTFSSRRAAKQDVSKAALEGISRKIISWISNKMSDEGFPSLIEEKGFCRPVLREFTEKMSLGRVKYETARVEGMLPGFLSSAILGGLKYTGEARKSKKEAELSAAREAIVSILGNLGLGTILPDIIKAKAKFFPSAYKRSCSNVCVGVSAIKGVTRDGYANKSENLIQNAAPELRTHTSEQVCLFTDEDVNKAGNLAENAAPIALDEQISNVQPLQAQHNLDLLNCNQKREFKITKKRPNKKLKIEVVAAS